MLSEVMPVQQRLRQSKKQQSIFLNRKLLCPAGFLRHAPVTRDYRLKLLNQPLVRPISARSLSKDSLNLMD
jgi:hypothetical protein